MTRAWSLALPVLTVFVVLYALLVAGAPRGIVGARVYGGPTEGASVLSLRIETVRREGESERPWGSEPLTLHAEAVGTPPLTVPLLHSVRGVADVALSFPRPIHGPLALELRDASASILARGVVSLDRERWAAGAGHRGGWIRGRSEGALRLSIAPERGTFVVGSSDPLVIRVERSDGPVAGARLKFSAEGARLDGAEGLRTDERGRARLSLEPSELNPTVRVEAYTDQGQGGLIDSGLPVVAGGLHGLATGTEIRVESAVPRTEAFFSVVSEQGRVTGGVLSLRSNGRGGSIGSAPLPALPHPAWLVVSSEVDGRARAAIGWPLDVGAEPASTFDVPEVLLLDGLPAAFAREQDRRSRVRWLCAAFIALAFLLSVVLLVVRVRAADRDITHHFSEQLDSEALRLVAPRRLLALLVALLAIGLGFVALGLVVAARSR